MSETKKPVAKKPATTKQIISRNKLMEAGVYFGHRKSQWNPKMKPYISKTMKGTHIIDINKTMKTLEFAYSIIKKMADRGTTFIFVGTRKQAKDTIKENALRTNSHYVSERWLGGTLTNNKTIFKRVRRMFELEKLATKDFAGYTKKEGLLFTKELAKLQKNLSGVKNMQRRPGVMIIADPQHDIIAVREAKKLGMHVIGLVDTNQDPSLVDIAIPANDDSVKSLTLLITLLADAIAEGKKGDTKFAYKKDEEIVLPEDQRKKQFNNRRRFSQNRRFDNRPRREEGKPNQSTRPATNPVVKKEVKGDK